MLTADLVRPRLHLRASELSIDMLDERDPGWLQTASDLVALLRWHFGLSLAAWD